MPNYSFKETINYFGEKLKLPPPEEDIEERFVELMLDENHIQFLPGKYPGSLHIRLEIGMFIGPILKEHLLELNTSNFMGINTGGCRLELDEAGSVISLSAITTPATTPQENWEWLHRVISIAQQWTDYLTKWEEFTPLAKFTTEKKDEQHRTYRTFKA